MVRVAILGATGYTALELIKLLLRHPEAEITVLTSRQEGNPHVGTVHPALVGRLDLRLEDLGAVAVAARADCVFSCLPHGVTATVVPQLLDTGVKVIDFSADYRLDDPATFRQWYGEEHPDGERQRHQRVVDDRKCNQRVDGDRRRDPQRRQSAPHDQRHADPVNRLVGGVLVRLPVLFQQDVELAHVSSGARFLAHAGT